jgi:hypothetical protein
VLGQLDCGLLTADRGNWTDRRLERLCGGVAGRLGSWVTGRVQSGAAVLEAGHGCAEIKVSDVNSHTAGGRADMLWCVGVLSALASASCLLLTLTAVAITG